MAVVKYLQCDICKQKITGLHKKFQGIYSFGKFVEHVCWDCWIEMNRFVMQKKKEKRKSGRENEKDEQVS